MKINEMESSEDELTTACWVVGRGEVESWSLVVSATVVEGTEEVGETAAWVSTESDVWGTVVITVIVVGGWRERREKKEKKKEPKNEVLMLFFQFCGDNYFFMELLFHRYSSFITSYSY